MTTKFGEDEKEEAVGSTPTLGVEAELNDHVPAADDEED